MIGFEWVAYYFFTMIMAAMNAKLLGASIVAALGLTVVYPNEDFAYALCLGLLISALLASFRD